MHKLDVMIPIYHYDKIKKIKAKLGISLAEIVRRALEALIEKHEKDL